MEPVKVAKLMRREKWKYVLAIKGPKLRFQKLLADKIERCFCSIKNVNATYSAMRVLRFSGECRAMMQRVKPA